MRRTVVSFPIFLVIAASGCGGANPGTGGDAGASSGAADAGCGDSCNSGVPDSGGANLPDGGASCAAAPTTFDDGLMPQRLLHVSTGGSDTTGDGTISMPFATIAAAARQATAGTSIVVHAGTYPGGGFIQSLSGTLQAPIWIGGAPGEARPILSGGSEAIHMSDASYVVLHDLEITGQTANGLNLDDGGQTADPTALHHLVFRNLFLHDVGTGGNNDCLKLSGANDFVVDGCELARCGGSGASGIDGVGCHHGAILRSRFHDLAASMNSVEMKGGSEDVLIAYNSFINGGQQVVQMGGNTDDVYFRPPLSTALPNFEAKNIRVVSNVIVGGAAAIAYSVAIDCVAAHNTIDSPTHWVARILQDNTDHGGYTFVSTGMADRFEDNIVRFNRARVATEVNIGAGTDPSAFVFSHDLWFAQDAPSQSAPMTPTADVDALIGMDPGFAGASSGDYSLTAMSAAVAHGIALPEAATDFTLHCFANPPAIGAYERR